MRAVKSMKWIVLLLLLATAGVGNVWADRGRGHGHGHARIGVFFGPVWDPWYYPPPYYPPYPPIVIERAPPPVYIEQSPPPVPAAVQQVDPASYWYYCSKSNGYYPYVKECPSGWQRVSPQPPQP